MKIGPFAVSCVSVGLRSSGEKIIKIDLTKSKFAQTTSFHADVRCSSCYEMNLVRQVKFYFSIETATWTFLSLDMHNIMSMMMLS